MWNINKYNKEKEFNLYKLYINDILDNECL